MSTIETGRRFLKSGIWDKWDELRTDQKENVPAPPFQEPYPDDAELVDLISPNEFTVGGMSIKDAIQKRRSLRQYTGEPLNLEELSYLLWATQGITHFINSGQTILRTVPSAGARHPFETYLFINNVTNLEPGLYRYLSLEHKLCCIQQDEWLVDNIYEACLEQYVHESAVVFIWTAVPYRTEWRYSVLSHKVIALDAGHMCQNLYLACESIGVGTCAIGAYLQADMDALLGVDGENEFAIYVATVGRVA